MQSETSKHTLFIKLLIAGLALTLIGLTGYKAVSNWVNAEVKEQPALPTGHQHATIAIVNPSPYAPGQGFKVDGDPFMRKITKAFEAIDQQARYVFMAYDDAIRLMDDNKLEAILAYNHLQEDEEKYYATVTLKKRELTVLTLASKQVVVEKQEDLEKLKTAIHPDLLQLLEPQLTDSLKNSDSLEKISNCMLLASLFYTEDIDAWITDKSFIDYCKKRLPDNVDTSPEIEYHDIFQPIPRNLLFKNKNLRDRVNQAWMALEQSPGE